MQCRRCPSNSNMDDIQTYHMTNEEHAVFKQTGVLPFVPLDKLGVNTAQPAEFYLDNIKENLKTNYPLFEELPEFYQIKGSENPIALVGGGPSLKGELNTLREFKTIMACGSSYSYLIENDIIPTYYSNIDPDAVCIKYLDKPSKETTYLLASCCHPSIFKHLQDYKVVVWHCDSDDFREAIQKLQTRKGYLGIGGGCTVGLRSIGLSMLLGYNNLHFFGFDSCITENRDLYAYDLKDKEYEMKGFTDIRPLKFAKGTKYEKDYLCVGYQIAQAIGFRDYFQSYGIAFTPTFHGGGLLSDLYDWMVGRMPC